MAGPLKVLCFLFGLFFSSFVRGQDKLTLMLKPPIERELFVNNKVVLEAVVSGDDLKTVQEASVSCKVKNETVTSVRGNIKFPEGTTQFIRTHYIFVDTKKWFDGELVTCSIHDRDIKQEISFDKGVNPQPPTLSLVPVITQKSTSVMCVIEDYYPKDLTVQWEVNDTNCSRQSNLEYELNDEGHYNTHSLCKVSSETWDANTDYNCVVNHLGKVIRVKKNFNTDKLTLTLKPPIERELFVHNKVVLEAVVSGDERKMVEEASVSCKVKNEPVTSDIGNINFSKDISQFIRIHNITVDTKKWFDGEMVTCNIRDRDIKQEISFDKGDGRTPSVIIYTPDTIPTDAVSLVCEVTSPKLGDVYIMWKVGNGRYIKGLTSAPIQRDDSISVLSILTVSKQYYEDPRNTITCAVKHDNIVSPLHVSTSKSKQPECPVDY